MPRVRLIALAVRNLGRRRLRTSAAVTAVAIGVATLLLMRGVTAGVQRINASLLVDGVLGALQVHRAGWSESAEFSGLTLDFEDSADLRSAVLKVDGVRAVAPRILFAAGLGGGDAEAQYFLATAFEPALEREVTRLRVEWLSRWPASTDEPKVVVSADLAASLPRGELGLLANDRDEALNGENVELGGIAKSGLPGNRRYGFVPLGLAQRLLRMEGRATEYAIAVRDGADLLRIKRELSAAVGPRFEVHTWDELSPFLKEIERGQNAFGVIMSGILLLVVLLGVASTMQMNVMDRAREVGTLLALGARRATVARLFVVEGALMGAIGAALGAALGLSGLWALRAAELRIAAPGSDLTQRIIPAVEPGWAVGCIAATLVGAVLASFFPARRVGRLDPIEALRES